MPALQPAIVSATSPTVPPTATLAHDAAGAAAQNNSPTAEGTPLTLRSGDEGIPARMLLAYREAAHTLTTDSPGCHLPWELLAAIGKVESGHAAGRPLSPDGTITRPILGPALNGTAGVALIRDTDHGTLDRDTVYDRAVGPMQFIPTTWASAGRDGNNDGRRDPHNIHDATLAAGHYLCSHGRDLTNPTQLRSAIYAYNPSETYVRTVLAWMRGYQNATAPTTVTTAPTTEPAGLATAPHQGPDPALSHEPSTVAEPAPPSNPTPATAPSPDRGPAPTPTRPAIIDGEPDITIIPLTPRPTASPSPAPAAPLPPATAQPAPSPTPTAQSSPTATASADPAPALSPGVSPTTTSAAERTPVGQNLG
ncbi:lytic transglycosylase domain-containing protein [Parafrankia elaeagni]|uniref:lytic transglycosylase domain-containing protein n=1 Tax=Parafrankia elaeagni TaxID=222534 RepID=UPI00035D9A14|nr:lytic transglycosylase domain-containing protein [Parafrankia elaeagni]